jgi:hypothetical protein
MKQIKALATSSLPDALMLCGIASLAYGAAQIFRPAGWIVAGGFAFGFGLMLARRMGNA